MLKMIGIIIVVISGMISGFLFSEKYIKRVDFLKIYIKLIIHIKNEILCYQKTLSEILNNFTCPKILNNYIFQCLNHLKNKSFSEAWKISFQNISSQVGLSLEEENIIINFGNSLGNSDLKTQISYLDYHLKTMQLHLNKAIENKKSKGNLPIILGASISLSIALLFI